MSRDFLALAADQAAAHRATSQRLAARMVAAVFHGRAWQPEKWMIFARASKVMKTLEWLPQ